MRKNNNIEVDKLISTCSNWLKSDKREFEGMYFFTKDNLPGIAQMVLFKESVMHCFLFVISKPTERQKWWQKIIENNSGRFFIVTDFEYFKSVIEIIQSENKPE